MKAKKALKRLARVETLLSGVITKYTAAGEHRVQEFLKAAKESVVHAEQALHGRTSAAAKKPPGRATSAGRHGLTAAGRRRLSLAAKERWAAAKRKGIHAVTGRPLKKTA
jgi:hypothetical protein